MSFCYTGHEKAMDHPTMNSKPTGTDYQPIACASYDQYEIAITRRRTMHLVWEDGNVVHDRIVTPLDLRIARGEEYLVMRLPEGDTLDVRLDHIRRAEIL